MVNNKATITKFTVALILLVITACSSSLKLEVANEKLKNCEVSNFHYKIDSLNSKHSIDTYKNIIEISKQFENSLIAKIDSINAKNSDLNYGNATLNDSIKFLNTLLETYITNIAFYKSYYDTTQLYRISKNTIIDSNRKLQTQVIKLTSELNKNIDSNVSYIFKNGELVNKLNQCQANLNAQKIINTTLKSESYKPKNNEYERPEEDGVLYVNLKCIPSNLTRFNTYNAYLKAYLNFENQLIDENGKDCNYLSVNYTNNVICQEFSQSSSNSIVFAVYNNALNKKYQYSNGCELTINRY